MRKLTTILCSIAFAISGFFLADAISKSDTIHGTTVNAATVQPQLVDLSKMQLPVDLQLNKLAHENKVDTVRDTITVCDTVYVKPKKSKKANVPFRVKKKTVHVPILYIATRTDVKEDTVNHENLHLYEIKKVGKIDLKKLNSSVEINQSYILIYSFALQISICTGKYIQQVALTYVRKTKTWFENMLAFSKGEKPKRQNEMHML